MPLETVLTSTTAKELAEALPVGIFRTDTEGNYLYTNQLWREMAHGQSSCSRFWGEALHPEDRDKTLVLWHQCVKSQLPFVAEFRFQHASSPRWVSCVAVLERDTYGQVTGYIGTVTDITERVNAHNSIYQAHKALENRVEERTADLRAKNRWLQQMITERKRAEAALLEERNFISTVLETAAALIIVCDRDGRIIKFNRSAQKLTGFTLDNVHGAHLWEKLTPPEERDFTMARFHQLANITATPIEYESYCLTQHGEKRLISWANSAIHSESDPVTYIFCIGTDITEQRQAEEEARQHHADLVHVSRLCTMGEMAAGLAHELNQPLAAIVNYTQGCVRRIAQAPGTSQHELLEALRQVTQQAQRAGEIIRHLRNFVSKSGQQLSRTAFNPLIRNVLNIAAMEVRKNRVVVRLRLSEPLPEIEVDIIQIEQVLLNLIRNGIEAMAASTDPKELLIRTTKNERNEVEFSITDHGEGIPSEADFARVFDAFFTTKSQGMGMGLAISRSIIEAHHGKLWVRRNTTQGVTFYFTLPAAPE